MYTTYPSGHTPYRWGRAGRAGRKSLRSNNLRTIPGSNHTHPNEGSTPPSTTPDRPFSFPSVFSLHIVCMAKSSQSLTNGRAYHMGHQPILCWGVRLSIIAQVFPTLSDPSVKFSRCHFFVGCHSITLADRGVVPKDCRYCTNQEANNQ